MQYPPYPLSSRARSIIFAVFTSLFLTIAPTVSLYTAGYRLSLHPLALRRVGVLSVDIEPNDAIVYLNNVRVVNSIPMRISDLVPGTYNLRIEKNGYLSWVKDIVIEDNKTTYIKDTTLFLVNTPEAIESNDTLRDVFPSHDGKYIVEKFQIVDQTKFVLFDTAQELATPILSHTNSSTANIVWSEKSNTLAIFEQKASSTNILVLEANNPTHYSNFHISGMPKYYQWKENFYKNTFLFTLDDFIYTLDAQKIYPPKALQTTSSVFFQDSNNADWYFDPINKSLENTKESVYLGVNTIQKIVDINTNRAIVQTESGLLIAGRDEKKEIKSIGTKNFFYDVDRKEYIAWSPYELWTMYDNGTIALLNRTSEEIQSVVALDKTGELLVVTGDKLLGFNPGYYVTHEILSAVQVLRVTADKQKRTLYFFGTWQEKKGLYKLKY